MLCLCYLFILFIFNSLLPSFLASFSLSLSLSSFISSFLSLSCLPASLHPSRYFSSPPSSFPLFFLILFLFMPFIYFLVVFQARSSLEALLTNVKAENIRLEEKIQVLRECNFDMYSFLYLIVLSLFLNDCLFWIRVKSYHGL